jgi:hypothetical protein
MIARKAFRYFIHPLPTEQALAVQFGHAAYLNWAMALRGQAKETIRIGFTRIERRATALKYQ